MMESLPIQEIITGIFALMSGWLGYKQFFVGNKTVEKKDAQDHANALLKQAREYSEEIQKQLSTDNAELRERLMALQEENRKLQYSVLETERLRQENSLLKMQVKDLKGQNANLIDSLGKDA